MKALNLLWALLPLGSLQAGTVLFNDFGAGNTYNETTGWTVSGTGSIGTSFTQANLFTLGGSGAESISQIDIGINNASGVTTFYASIWTDVGNLPGTEVSGAFWGSLTTTGSFGACDDCVTSITGIAGLTLTGGDQYFLILGPVSTSDTSWNAWNWNSTGVNGLDLFSEDGGTTWSSNGNNLLGAFDAIGGAPGVPEPGTLLLLGSGSIGVAALRRRKAQR